MAGDAAQNAATKINPSEDQLAQIDRPAEDNTWHDVPSVSELKNQAKAMYDKNKPFSKDDAKGATDDAAKTAPQDASTGTAAQEGAQVGAQNLADTTKANIPQETQNRAKEAASKTRAQTKAYLDKKVPKERREQTIWRLKKMIVEIQGHDDCELSWKLHSFFGANPAADQQAIETLLYLAETYGGHGKDLTGQGAGTVKGAHADFALKTAEADLKVCRAS